jgi:predicted nuclease of predicted toxin-antitoxin system
VILWLDAQLPPVLASWMCNNCGVQAVAVREAGLREATDERIFFEARAANAVVLTKDSDFVSLLERHGVPPRVIWLTVGNGSNDALRTLLQAHWQAAAHLLEQGEALVEIGTKDLR